MTVDYSIYLVTDSTMVPASSSFLKQVEDAISGGATMVQLREKSLSTLEFVERAKATKALTQKENIPLIINDRIDVALAVDADGVHVGQDDMPAKLARELIGPHKILGVTCSNPEEVEVVCREQVADYVGIGTVYKTNTKKDTKTPEGTGPIGIRRMLQVLKKHNTKSGVKPVKCVAIGGINEKNLSKVLYQCCIENQRLDGVAVVSCIMAHPDALQITRYLKEQFSETVPWERDLTVCGRETSASKVAVKQLEQLREAHPLVHHITNNVVKNFSANVTLAIGASPIMSELAEEFCEFTKTIPNIALVLNLGTPTAALMDTFITAIQEYNKAGKHIVFDPVAAGATTARLESCRKLLNAGHMSVIKGNVGEIAAIWKLCSDYKSNNSDMLGMRGVDSVAETAQEDILAMAQAISKDFKCTVVVTGAVNYIVGALGEAATMINGGSPLMGSITGSGCSLGSVIAAFVAAKADGTPDDQFNIFNAVCAAVFLYNLCGKKAGDRSSLPGTFMTEFLDTLYHETHKSIDAKN